MNTSPTIENIQELMSGLIELGEDRGEMNMWFALFKAMTDSEKKALYENLEKELATLKELS